MMHRCVNDHFPFNLNQPSSDLTREWTLRWTHFRKERLEIFQPFFAPPQNLYNNTKLIKILLYIYIFGSNGESIFSIHRPGRLWQTWPREVLSQATLTDGVNQPWAIHTEKKNPHFIGRTCNRTIQLWLFFTELFESKLANMIIGILLAHR